MARAAAKTPKQGSDPVSQLVHDTVKLGKQTLVFVSTKRSAESVAEELAKQFPVTNEELAKKILKALSSPTKQCKRLAWCVERGTAFHHAGLVAAQRHAVEEAFIAGKLHTISATPTLAAGVNVPAFRVIIRDLHRFDGYMQEIPMLEYLQMAGRAGRPDFHDDYGEAITIAKTPGDVAWIKDTYWDGTPEPIYSKLASLPALRTAVLSLDATRFVRTKEDLRKFFAKTLFSFQYRDANRLEAKLQEVEEQLSEWGFLHGEEATPLGRRVSQLYIDPLSAHILMQGISSAKAKTDEAIMHTICSCIEMRPLLRLKASDFAEESIHIQSLLTEPSMFSTEYEEYLQSAKTANMLLLWMGEAPEETILEQFGVRPGELHVKKETGDWLLYSATELCKVLNEPRAPFYRARLRLKYGVRPEIVPLLRLRGIGRVRARKLFTAGLVSIQDVAKAPDEKLVKLLGPTTAKRLREQLREQK